VLTSLSDELRESGSRRQAVESTIVGQFGPTYQFEEADPLRVGHWPQ